MQQQNQHKQLNLEIKALLRKERSVTTKRLETRKDQQIISLIIAVPK